MATTNLNDISADTLTSAGLVTGSDVAVGSGSLVHVASGTVARTDTTAKTLFVLPANAVVTGIRVYVPVASDAVTTATVSVGTTGSPTLLLNAQDVKGAGTGSIAAGAKSTLGSIGSSALTIKGVYADTGGAATTGGPYLILVEYTTR